MAVKSPELVKFLDLRAIYAEKAERCKHSYRYFFKQAWPTMEPGTPFLPARHIDAIAEHLQAVADGHIKRLAITIAPGHAKSTSVSQAFPAWVWTRNPELRFLCASHALDLAIRDNRNCRNLIQSEWYQTLFGDVFQMSGDQNVKSYFENDKRGYRLAMAVRSSGTGKRGDILLCLCYNAEVTTNIGRLRIGEIVEKQLPVRVLAYDHATNVARWQEIEAYEKNPGRPCVRVTLNDGRVIDATADHPFYVVGRGYVPAAQLTNTDKVITDESFLRELRKRDNPQAVSISQAKPLLLRQTMSSGLAKGTSSSLRVPSVQCQISHISLCCEEEQSNILQYRVLSSLAERKEGFHAPNSDLRGMRKRVQAASNRREDVRAPFLQQGLSKDLYQSGLRNMRQGNNSQSIQYQTSGTCVLQSGLSLCAKEQGNHSCQSEQSENVYLRGVRQRVREISELCHPNKAQVLQSCMSWDMEQGSKQHRISRRQDRTTLPLRENISCQSGNKQDGYGSVLLQGVLQQFSARGSVTTLSELIRQMRLLRNRDQDYSTQDRQEEFLFSQMRQSSTQQTYQRREQSSLRGRHGSGAVSQRIQGFSACDKGTRQSAMPMLWQNARRKRQRIGCSSYRLRHLPQRAIQSDFSLSLVPWKDAWVSGREGTTENVLVKSVESISTPEYVYNIRVASDHNYFANGVLVHNCDDPNNAMAGEADVLATIDWHSKTWQSRLNDLENGAMIAVGQRLHQKDLIGHLLELGGWEHLDLPTEYEPSRRCFTSIGWSDWRTYEGELLWPERFNSAMIADLKRSLGSMAYAAQYQQRPAPQEGGLFKKQWLRYYSETPEAYILHKPEGTKSVAKDQCWKFGTVDLAISSKQSADYTVMSVWGVTPEYDLILLDMFRDRVDNAEQLRQIKTMHTRHDPDYWRVETIAYQLAFFQQAVNEGIPAREYKPVKDKVSRATTAAVRMENGKNYLPKNAAYLVDVETELLLFPKGEHDDIVDNFSIANDEAGNPRMPMVGGGGGYEEDMPSIYSSWEVL